MATDPKKKKSTNPKPKSFDAKAFKKGIYAVETNSGQSEWNTTSSATGKYQFLYNDIKDIPEMKGVTREQFAKNYDLQEKIMDMAVNGKIRNRPGYYKNASDLTKDYKTMFGDKWNYREDEVAVLSHFLGRQGARDYLNAEATGGNYTVPGKNLEVEDYLQRYNKGAGYTRGLGKTQNLNASAPTPKQGKFMVPNEREQGLMTQDNLDPANFKPQTILTPGQGSPKSQPTKQQVKPEQQTTSTDFLIDYLGNNEFAKGGDVKNGPCGGPGQPPCPDLTVDSKNHPRYTAYQDSLSAFNSNEVTRGTWDKELREFMGDTSQGYQDELTLSHSELGADQKAAYKKHFKEDIRDVSDETVDAWESKYKGISPTSIGRSKLIEPSGNVAKSYDQPAVAEYPLYPKPNQEVKIENNYTEKVGNKWYIPGSKRHTEALEANKSITPTKEKKVSSKNYNGKYAYRDDTGAYQYHDVTDDTDSQQRYKEAKGKQGFRNLNKTTIENQLEMGGQINKYQNGGQNQGGMTHIPKSAGTHAQNPNGGVQVGMGENGKANTVEGGETMKNDYVYSDTLKLDDAIIKKVGLPKNFKGKTMAEASKMIQGPVDEQVNNKIVKDTADENLAKLKSANEIVRMAQEVLNPKQGNTHTMPDGSEMPGSHHNQNQATEGFDFGAMSGTAGVGLDMPGGAASGASGVSSGAGAASSGGGAGAGAYVGAASTALDMGMDIATADEWDKSGLVDSEKVDQVGGALSGTMKGASAGMAFGPIGAGVGAVIGLGTSLIAGNKKQKAADKQRLVYDQRQMNSFFLGGDLNQFKTGGDTDPFGNAFSRMSNQQMDTSPIEGREIENLQFVDENRQNFMGDNSGSIGAIGGNLSSGKSVTGLGDEFGLTQSPTGNTPELTSASWWDRNKSGIGDKAAQAARYAPAAMNALQLGKLGGPEEESLDRLDNRYKPNYMDERTMQNQAESAYNNAARALTGASGGSQGALRANLLAAHLNKQKGVSQAYQQAAGVNRSQDDKAQNFNLSVDSKNIAQSNQEKDWNARNRGAYDSNKSKLLSQIGTDVGNIGLEETRKKYPEKLGLLYDYLGKFQG